MSESDFAAEPRPRAPRRTEEVLSIGFATLVAVLALIYTLRPFTPILIAWEAIAVIYLILVFTTFRNRATRGIPSDRRPVPGRILEYLTWALPLAASGTGITSAVTLLITGNSLSSGSSGALVNGLLGAVGVVVAWFLLQTGFAEIYEVVYERLPDPSMISFPGIEQNPTLGDFLYLSFTVGTSFAISGATVGSRRVRRVILIHSVTSFFYNAFLIAIAIQVIQGTIAGR